MYDIARRSLLAVPYRTSPVPPLLTRPRGTSVAPTRSMPIDSCPLPPAADAADAFGDDAGGDEMRSGPRESVRSRVPLTSRNVSCASGRRQGA
jgi:hypothetical protein